MCGYTKERQIAQVPPCRHQTEPVDLVDNLQNTRVTVKNDFHVSKAVFLPRPQNADTVSHPVTAWKKGKPVHMLGLRLLAIACAGMYLKCFPTPKEIQSSSTSSFVR